MRPTNNLNNCNKPPITIAIGRRQITHKLLLAALLIFLASCSTIPTTPFPDNEIRTINVLIGTDGSHDENEIMGLFQQFNGESIYETGILLNPVDIIPFDMNEQEKIWPACQELIPCWADYAYLSGIKYDIAVTFIENTPILNFVIGGTLGYCDTTKYRYIVLKTTNYRAFKHELLHTFHHGHSSSGIMFPINNFCGIPLFGTGLSEESRQEILRHKWRSFD